MANPSLDETPNEKAKIVVKLRVISGPYDHLDLVERTITLSPGKKLTIGRNSNHQARDNGYFDNPIMSRDHAELHVNNHGQVFLTDSRSSHGTYVNGRQLAPLHRQPLVTCDTVRFGATIARGLTIREPLEVAVTFGKGEGFETEEADTKPFVARVPGDTPAISEDEDSDDGEVRAASKDLYDAIRHDTRTASPAMPSKSNPITSVDTTTDCGIANLGVSKPSRGFGSNIGDMLNHDHSVRISSLMISPPRSDSVGNLEGAVPVASMLSKTSSTLADARLTLDKDHVLMARCKSTGVSTEGLADFAAWFPALADQEVPLKLQTATNHAVEAATSAIDNSNTNNKNNDNMSNLSTSSACSDAVNEPVTENPQIPVSTHDEAHADDQKARSADSDADGYNSQGFDSDDFDQEGHNEDGFNRKDRDREGYDYDGLDEDGFDRHGHDASGADCNGTSHAEFDEEDGYDRHGFNKEGYDEDGFNYDGYDCEGYDRNGLDAYDYDGEDYDRLGYDRDGLDAQGLNCEGYDRWGYNCARYTRRGCDYKAMHQYDSAKRPIWRPSGGKYHVPKADHDSGNMSHPLQPLRPARGPVAFPAAESEIQYKVNGDRLEIVDSVHTFRFDLVDGAQEPTYQGSYAGVDSVHPLGYNNSVANVESIHIANNNNGFAVHHTHFENLDSVLDLSDRDDFCRIQADWAKVSAKTCTLNKGGKENVKKDERTKDAAEISVQNNTSSATSGSSTDELQPRKLSFVPAQTCNDRNESFESLVGGAVKPPAAQIPPLSAERAGKRKADDISTTTAEEAEVMAERVVRPTSSPASVEERPRKRLRRVVEALAFAALGGVAVFGSLAATAPSL